MVQSFDKRFTRLERLRDIKRDPWTKEEIQEAIRRLEELRPIPSLFSEKLFSISVKHSEIHRRLLFPKYELISGSAIFDHKEVGCLFASDTLKNLKAPLEEKTWKIDLLDYLNYLIPNSGRQIGLVSFQNGIMNEPEHFLEMGELILGHLTETPLFRARPYPLCFGLYNPILDLILHAERIDLHLNGIFTDVVRRTYCMFKQLMSRLLSINPNVIWLHIVHSEAAAIAHIALKEIQKDKKIAPLFKKHLIVAAYGPVLPIPREFVLRAFNNYSPYDHLANAFKTKFENDDRYDLTVVEAKGLSYPQIQKGTRENRINIALNDGHPAPEEEILPYVLADHAFKNKTYQSSLGEDLKDISKVMI